MEFIDLPYKFCQIILLVNICILTYSHPKFQKLWILSFETNQIYKFYNMHLVMYKPFLFITTNLERNIGARGMSQKWWDEQDIGWRFLALGRPGHSVWEPSRIWKIKGNRSSFELLKAMYSLNVERKESTLFSTNKLKHWEPIRLH